MFAAQKLQKTRQGWERKDKLAVPRAKTGFCQKVESKKEDTLTPSGARTGLCIGAKTVSATARLSLSDSHLFKRPRTIFSCQERAIALPKKVLCYKTSNTKFYLLNVAT